MKTCPDKIPSLTSRSTEGLRGLNRLLGKLNLTSWLILNIYLLVTIYTNMCTYFNINNYSLIIKWFYIYTYMCVYVYIIYKWIKPRIEFLIAHHGHDLCCHLPFVPIPSLLRPGLHAIPLPSQASPTSESLHFPVPLKQFPLSIYMAAHSPLFDSFPNVSSRCLLWPFHL